MLAAYRSYRVCGASLGLYVGNLGNLHVLWGVLEPVWGCMLATYATYMSYGVCLGQFGAGNLQVLWGVWSQFGAVCWQPRQPTCLMGCVGASLGLYVGNQQVLWGVLEPLWGYRSATYRSYGMCWSQFWGRSTTYRSYGVRWCQFGAVCWQPTCLMGCVGASLRLYVGNLQVLVGAWSQFGTVCCQPGQPTCLLECVGASLGLYVGNLQVLWSVFEPVWGCMLATCRSFGVCWSQFGAGNLKVLWGVWSQFGAVCWQMLANVGNLHVLWGVLEPVCGCMLATYKSYGVCWSQFGAVCWQPIGLMGCV